MRAASESGSSGMRVGLKRRELLRHILGDDPEPFELSASYAAGLAEWLHRGPLDQAWAVKGQVTGPVSLGLQISDQKGRPSLYDDIARDVLIKNVLRQAQWQETRLAHARSPDNHLNR